MHVTSCEVHGAVRCVDHRGRQDRRRDVDRHQVLPHQERHQDHQGVRHQGRQDEDQNQDVRQGHRDRQGEGRQDQGGYEQFLHRDVSGS